jgi:hypothetical protein
VREGVFCLAAPVFDAAGCAVAGVGVCVHKPQLAADGGERHRSWLLQLARTLTQRLGGDGPSPVSDPSRPAWPAQVREYPHESR